jgi:hypothetical protein
VVNVASDVLRDVELGVLKAADVQGRAVSVVREMVGQVNGPGYALWSLHLDICRQVLGAGGLSANELREWVAVQARREATEGLPSA